MGAGLQDEGGADELPPGGLFSGGSERESRKRKQESRKERARFRRVEDWEPCALGNLPDLNDLNGTPPPLLGLSPVGALASGAATFQPGPEPCGAQAATEPPQVGVGRAEAAEEAQASDEEAAGGAPDGEDNEELYIRLL